MHTHTSSTVIASLKSSPPCFVHHCWRAGKYCNLKNKDAGTHAACTNLPTVTSIAIKVCNSEGPCTILPFGLCLWLCQVPLEFPGGFVNTLFHPSGCSVTERGVTPCWVWERGSSESVKAGRAELEAAPVLEFGGVELLPWQEPSWRRGPTLSWVGES